MSVLWELNVIKVKIGRKEQLKLFAVQIETKRKGKKTKLKP